MSIKITFLGTAGSVPTPERSLPAVAIQRKDELILLDCGEGVQRQIIKAKLGLHKKTKIFITHMHGDHILGLPGLIQTMTLMDRKRKLQVYGPKGIQAFIKAIENTVQFTLTFPIEIQEIKQKGIVCEEKEYEVRTIPTKHVIPSFAYTLEEKPRPGKFYPEKALQKGVPEGPLWSELQSGKSVILQNGSLVRPEEVMGPKRSGRKIVYTGDTKPFKALIEFAKEADLLIHDSTFDDKLGEKAKDDGHSTPSQAAKIAKKANVRQLVLTHISARYKDVTILLEQAKKIFPNVLVAEDLMEINLPLLP
jgi:ribonuclease Z